MAIFAGGHAGAAAPAFLALSCAGLVAGTAHAAPGDAPNGSAETTVEAGTDQSRPDPQRTDQPADSRTITVTGQRPDGELESPRATQELLDTPQTVTVISDQTLRRQNLLTLRDALATIPGITFGAGEGGGGYGDAINLRGYSGNNDINVDGVRDGAQYSRTDPFNLQQIEVYNGANSVFNGSGSIGGTINLVSKAPQASDLAILSGAVGTDRYFRGTIDLNHRLSDLVAVRINAMAHRNDVPGRDVEQYERWGVAPSLTIGIDGPTSLTFAYVHQQDDNIPIYGVPYFRGTVLDGPLPEVDPSDYFGYRNVDTQRQTLDRVTITFAHEFSESVSLRNLSRWQRVGQLTQASQPQGTFCLSTTGRQPIAGDATSTVGLACPAGLPAGFFLPSGRGVYRDQENQLLHNQTDVTFETGRQEEIRNILVVGGSFTFEDYGLTSGTLLQRDAAGALTAQPLINLANPDTVYPFPTRLAITGRSVGDLNNQALYAFDTLEFGIVELNAAIRYERNDATFQAVPLASYPVGTTPPTTLALLPQTSEEELFSYRFGAVLKPSPDISLYAAYGNSRTPSSATVRLGCGVATVDGGASPCNAEPESGVIYEIGGKIDLLNRRLQVTASLFRNERSNFRVASNDPLQPAGLQALDGSARVDGVAIGFNGFITPEWTIFANYTYLDSEVLQSVSDFCLATPSAACLNSAAVPDPQAGDRLIQTPEHSASLFTSYRLPFGLEVGYGFTYQGTFALNQRNLFQRRQFDADDFLIHRLFVSYEIRPGITAQLNVQNATDEPYYNTIRNNVNAATGAVTGGWAAPGDGRSVVLSLFYSF